MKKLLNKIPLWSALLLAVFCVYSCKYYIKHDFRKVYTDVNEVIHDETNKVDFFKIHFTNGDVSLLNNWRLNTSKDSIIGDGQLYDFHRIKVIEGQLAFNLDDIAIIETNQLDPIKSKDNERVAAMTILTAANVAMNIVCISNPKACFGSCPTFYIDKTDRVHDSKAEGFSNSISPALERQDLDALQYRTSSDKFYLTMKNEAFETHAINKLTIEAVALEKNKSVFHDKDGTYYQCGQLFKLNKANSGTIDVRDLMAEIDEQEYFSFTDSTDLTTKEELILEFDDIPDQELGLVINYRQTLLTTFLLYSGISYMGDEVGDYFAKIETDIRMKKRLANPFERLGKVDLYLWNAKKNKWEFLEGLYETGPISKNLIFSPILKNKHRGGPLKIKIEMTKGLWRLDYVGLAAIDNRAESIAISPSKMEVITGNPCSTEKVEFDDENYLISFPGDEFRFEYDLPEISKNKEYELFLSSQGYYIEWIRDEWLKGKDLSKLKLMLMNDKDTWRDLAIEFKTLEHEMEAVFWNSKYSNIQ